MRSVPGAGPGASSGAEASTINRVRRVLAIKPFRRLWGVTYLCSVADWLNILALTGLATKLTDNYFAQNFAFVGVVLTGLAPGLLFAPIGGLLADRFDRRKVMVVADLLRCGFLLSIAIVGAPWWLLVGNFLVGCASSMWIPSKEAAVPNLLRRPDQVETANQLGMVMTYGLAVITAAGANAIITGVNTTFHLFGDNASLSIAKLVVIITGLLYLASAIILATRIPELSLRNVHALPEQKVKAADEEKFGVGQMIADGFRFIRSTPLVRGLLVGAFGAFAAGGAVIGSAKPYSSSLLAGDSAFNLLVLAVFLGLATGMATAPKLARRLAHDRLFGISIVAAAVSLTVVALSPHLAFSLVAVFFVGIWAGTAFLTGVTIIGSRVEDAIRGRINAIYQLMMKLVLFGTTVTVPLLVGLVHQRNVTVWGSELSIDGTRPVMLGGAVIALVAGLFAYRQMDDKRTEPILADLRNALRRTPRRVNGFLIAVEGTTAINTAIQAVNLADWLRGGTRPVVVAADPALDDQRLTALVSGASLTGARAQALAAAAVRADIVERHVQPALDAGSVVVMERFVDSPLAHLSAVAGLDSDELEGLADWATGRLRPDLTVLLDAAPNGAPRDKSAALNDQWRVQHLLTEMAAADPDRYVVIDADGTDTEVAERIRTALRAVFVGRLSALAPTTEKPVTLPLETLPVETPEVPRVEAK
ncbi:bifunctional MFS transporter/dTMP kinase [Amycolatopsis vancoresmycina]|uniref:Thymidylate kinase n=1 Tax=Amycolatopsis vancoresmycina DSM 44592 TaxID=1292037 RepID=R1FZ81_9PSEU|nr:dTMP kinase [Amycolatopsis vancoresmycina]EOD64653.1 thymidylate kinase [Amycolatopsis vancoresmycina DSM 44592]